MNKSGQEVNQRLIKIVAYGIFSGFFAIVLIAILFALAYASEIYAPFLWENRRFNVASDHFVPSAKFGWTLQPNIKINLVTESGKYTDDDYFTSNGYGFRETSKVRNGSNQIIMLGDSFVQGYYLSNRETIPYRLAIKLDKNVFNAGVGGYSTDNEFSVMKELLKVEKPKAVVLLFFANDLPFSVNVQPLKDQINDRYQEKKVSRSEVNGGEYKKYDPNIIKETKICCSQISYQDEIAKNIRAKFKKYLRLTSNPMHLLNTIREDFKYIFPSQDQYAYQLDLNSKIRFYERPDLLESAFNRSFETLHRMSELAKTKGIDFYIFWVPEIAQIFDKAAERDILNGYFLRNCQKFDLNCIDPTAEFRKNPTRNYIMDDGHFSPLGADLMADQIAKKVGYETRK